MKKVLSMILCIVFITTLLPIVPFTASAAESGTCGDNVTWTIDDEGTLTISGTGDMYDCNKANKDWEKTAAPWENYKSEIKKIVISEGVTRIGNYAFSGCSALETIVYPSVATTAVIGRETFTDCPMLKSVTIPEGVTEIGYYVFDGCTALTEINIPESATWLRCSFIGSALYNGEGDAWEDGVLYMGKYLVRVKSDVTTVNVKAGTTIIDYSAFKDCTALESVTLPDGVKSVWNWSFKNCRSLREITLPDSVEEIGVATFEGCTSLEKITIGAGLKKIDNSAFVNCKNLTEITIPNGATEIGYDAFTGCNSLRKITIPASVTSMGQYMFDDFNATTIYCSPNSTAQQYAIDYRINYRFIGDTTELDDVPRITKCGENVTCTLDSKGVLTISGKGEMICYFYSPVLYKSYSDLIKEVIVEPGVVGVDGSYGFNNLDSMVSLTLPERFYGLQSNTFENCTSLENINLPDDIEIRAGMFNDSAYYNNPDNWDGDLLYIGKHLVACKNKEITEVTVKKGTTSIADEVFSGCEKLEKLDLPNSLLRIGDKAFLNCSALVNITIPESVNQIGSSAFTYTGYYNDENNWENDMLYIGENFIRVRNESDHSELNIKEGTRLIADKGCYSHYLTTVTIPDSVKFIGNYALYECSNLETVSIPSGVIRIGQHAFWNCDRLKALTIPYGVSYIGKGAFLASGQLTVTCYSGTVGHQYVVDNNIPCNVISRGGFTGGGGGSSKPKVTTGLTNFKNANSYDNTFTDVAQDAWYQDSVKVAYELDLVKGAAEGKFNPDGNMTIAEAVTLAARIHSIYNTGKAEFTQGEVWYQVYVDYAVEKGIIEENQFTDYNRPATRAEFAGIFAKAIPEKDYNAINKIEAGAIPDVAESDAVYLLYKAGIVAGSDEAHSFLPDSNIKRCEVATIITRIVDKEKRITFEI